MRLGFSVVPLFYCTIYLCDEKKKQLELDDVEYFASQTEVYMWLSGTPICVFSLWLPSNFIGFAG